MQSTQCAPELPVPTGWSAEVKGAFVRAVALARVALTVVRGYCAEQGAVWLGRASELERLRSEVALLREELRIKDARMARLAPPKRPHYAAPDRLAVLELKAARGWNLAETVRVFLLTPLTVAAWLRRLDEQGPEALVRLAVPINRFPDAVAHMVQRLKVSFPNLGRQRIADLLLRAGLELGPSTVRRMIGRTLGPALPPSKEPKADSTEVTGSVKRGTSGTGVVSRYPNHVWSTDITIVPTALGFWLPWFPGSVVPSWPFAWHVAVVMDHFSRKVLAFEVFPTAPTGTEMCALFDVAIGVAGGAPRHAVTDRGCQFRGDYLEWCEVRGVKPRFGAVGKKGSIAVTERLILTLKQEGLRWSGVPYGLARMRQEVTTFIGWYNEIRPHTTLAAATPAEVFAGGVAERPERIEPRARYPAEDGRRVPAEGLRLRAGWFEGRAHLPVVTLDVAA